MLYTYLDLSTGYLTQRTMDKMQRGDNNWPAMSIGAYPNGFFVTVPDVMEQSLSSLPDDLAGVMRYAQRLGIALLRFDSDGDTVPGLTRYED
jgi:hypothetical protein